MKSVCLLLTLAVVAFSSPVSAQDNLGFEYGNFYGWSAGPATWVVTSHQGAHYGTKYYPKDGKYFAVVRTYSCNANTISRSVYLQAGQTLTGYAAFDAGDYLPYNDFAKLSVSIYGSSWQLFYSNVSMVGNYGDGPWINWSFTAPQTGNFNLVFAVKNERDCGVDSYGLLDIVENLCPDLDGDGLCDADDNCPEVANPGQENADGDEFGDACDPCMFDPDNDMDGDGVCGDVDICPYVFDPGQENADGDEFGDACDFCPFDPDNDVDEDGVCGDEDICPLVYDPGQENSDGDEFGDACDICPFDPDNDVDEDGVCGDEDNCPELYNPGQENADEDEYGDACDPCPFDPENDADGDGVCGDVDNCPYVANEDQLDFDGDEMGDACDPDDDNDGVEDEFDNCQFVPNPDQADNDGDGDGDLCDPDDDNDGVDDEFDNCQFDANSDQADAEGDGIGDVCDPDDDNDLVVDEDDECPGTPLDTLVDGFGCSIEQYCPCKAAWRNKGAYVSCVAKTSESFLLQGLLTAEEKDEIVSAAARSLCGVKR